MQRTITASMRYAEKQYGAAREYHRQATPSNKAAQPNASPDGVAQSTCADGRAQRTLGKALTLAAMSLGYVVVQLDVTIVNVAINSIGADFGGSVAELQWIVNAYTITFAAFILTAGALGDRLGARAFSSPALRSSCWHRSPVRSRRPCRC